MVTGFRKMGPIALLLSILCFLNCGEDKIITDPNYPQPPSVPSNPNPGNGATGIDTIIVFTWQCSDGNGDSLMYDFYLDTLSIPVTMLDSNLATSTYQTDLEVSRDYYWKVVARDDGGLETSSPIWHFSTMPGPEQIAYNSDGIGSYRMFLMNADGSNVRIIGDTTEAGDGNPTLSYDGSKIVFGRQSNGMYSHIWTMNCDGAERFEVTHEDLEASCPVLSPDGSQIAFLVEQGSLLPKAIYLVNSNGGNTQPISDYIVGIEGWKLSWSPDGTKIAFESASLNQNGLGICVINSDGTEFQRLTVDSTYNCDPAWSHDGTKFAFSRYEIQEYYSYYQIYVMNADGSNPHNITNTTAYELSPCWSPDDSQLAFSSDRDGNYEIYVMNADGSNQHRITDNPGHDWGASWAPYHR